MTSRLLRTRTDDHRTLGRSVAPHVIALEGVDDSFDAVLDLVGDASLVLLGEATHGTFEFYAARAAISKRLIVERGFTAIAAEADWPDAYRVNCYVRGRSGDRDADGALASFGRFPTWMWRNEVVSELVGWLRDHNESATRRVGFYGLDIYGLHRSIEAVLSYLDKVDPDEARRARLRYGCFGSVAEDGQAYGYSAHAGTASSCEDEVVDQLVALQRAAGEHAARDGRIAEDEQFFAEQNARLVVAGEQYYREMYRGNVRSWNLRDVHMAETLAALHGHLGRDGTPPKIVVWEHNSHVGDARATAMGRRGELNVGQLARQRYGDDVVLIGFTTFDGTVRAASDWGADAEVKTVRPALEGSYEAAFHHAGSRDFFLPLGEDRVAESLSDPRLERAIGVIYRPETERASHYFEAVLPEQFDGVVHFDTTAAIRALPPPPDPAPADLPETFPEGV
ncbi:MAG: erythromycin esterase family protein [Actinomycetota bacterium]|nr:erythromycin esterase family protein [Actinomycetota bacterium]